MPANGLAGDSARLAFDRASVRTYDQDGRLHIEIANISKAAVNPYLGREIPDFDSLGLDPDRVYRLLRDPQELEKAAPTFNGLPVIDALEQTGKEHIPVSALSPRKEIVVGSTGTDAVFEAPYLKNSMAIWDARCIAGIESEWRKEISSAYHYRADMTPGNFQGDAYDGVMRDLVGNHVAIVTQGRAGSDVVVGDSKLEIQHMSKKPLSRKAAMAKGALLAHLKPKLAADAKIDLNPVLAGVTAANWMTAKASIAAAIKPKLAQDADLEDVIALLDGLDGEEPDDADVAQDDDVPADMPAVDASPIDDVISMLKGKVSDEDLAAIEAKLRALKLAADEDPKPADKPADPPADKPAADNPPPTPGTPAPPAPAAQKEDAVDKPAMDAAIRVAVKAAEDATIKRLRAIAEAESIVQPWVGKLVAQDSAESVYRAALETLGVDVSGIHPSAFRAVLQAQPKPDATRPRVAMDSAAVKGFAERYPQASKVRNLG